VVSRTQNLPNVEDYAGSVPKRVGRVEICVIDDRRLLICARGFSIPNENRTGASHFCVFADNVPPETLMEH
jgi:hypothetical protein